MKLESNTFQLLSKQIWFRSYHCTSYFQHLGPSVPHADLQRIKTAVEDISALKKRWSIPKISPRRPYTVLYRAIIMWLQWVTEFGKQFAQRNFVRELAGLLQCRVYILDSSSQAEKEDISWKEYFFQPFQPTPGEVFNSTMLPIQCLTEKSNLAHPY